MARPVHQVRAAAGDVVHCLEVTYLGRRFLYPESSEVGAAIARGWEWDHVLRPIVDGVLPSANPTICEVGSNIGASVLEILAVRPSARVTCYEPSDRYRAVLELNLAAAGFANANISVRDRIVDRQPGIGHIYTDDTSGSIRPGGHLTKTQEADAVRLDDEFLDRDEPLQFLKTDTDGNDIEVLRGAERILAEDQPVLFAEFCPELIPTDPVADLQWLQGLGYTRFVCFDHLGSHVGTTGDAGQAAEWSADLLYCDILTAVEGSDSSERVAALQLTPRADR